MAFGPGLFGRGEAATVAEQEFGEPMARAEQIGADVFATAQQIARGLFLLGRNMNRGERAGLIQKGQLTRVATIRFDAIARAPRNYGRGDDVTGNILRRARALQLEAARPG